MASKMQIALVLVCACTLESKSAGEEGSDTGSSSDGGSGSMSATGSSMSATGSTVSATGSGESDSGGPICPEYDSAPDIGPVVELAVRSEATTPVYLAASGCFASPRLEIVGPGGAVDHLLGECTETCDAILDDAEGSCLVGCPDCGTVSAERIEPGAEEVARWTGRMNASVALDPACTGIDDPSCPETCKVSEQAPAGSYELSLTVYRSCTGECACDGEVVPTCGLYTQVELGDPQVYTVTIDYPSQTMGEIVITD